MNFQQATTVLLATSTTEPQYTVPQETSTMGPQYILLQGSSTTESQYAFSQPLELDSNIFTANSGGDPDKDLPDYSSLLK